MAARSRPMTREQLIEATKTWAKPGMPVRCGGVPAFIHSVHNKFSPGAVMLDRRIEGFVWWNVDSLTPDGD